MKIIRRVSFLVGKIYFWKAWLWRKNISKKYVFEEKINFKKQILKKMLPTKKRVLIQFTPWNALFLRITCNFKKARSSGKNFLERMILNVKFFLKSMILKEKFFWKAWFWNTSIFNLSDLESTFLQRVTFWIEFIRRVSFLREIYIYKWDDFEKKFFRRHDFEEKINFKKQILKQILRTKNHVLIQFTR